MPVYDYECKRCGPFSALRPMAQCAEPLRCDCGALSARVILRAPAIVCRDAGKRKANAVNEEARHEPKLASKHGLGCGCCGCGKIGKRSVSAASGAKSFPSARPWMISH